MSVDQWERIKQILEDALRFAPEQRRAFLDSACGPDSELRAEVQSLIASYEQAGSQFLAAAAPELLKLAAPDSPATGLNKAIGHYRLVEEIGRGGMGQVWLAEQTAPVKRRVALKLIKAGMYDDETVKRFQLERQSLALMDHPSIAKVFDAGATSEGQPYFVMEYVPGKPLTAYCDQKRLKIGERLELFIKVCEAVQHAHQKAIIHRDLKPANILVQEIDGRAVPRIIDFGLAKAITPQMAGETLFTRFGSFVGTPGYMSPEQSDRSGLDVDTRSDVYSLGVVLYVLLTGCLPFQTKPGKEQPLDDMLRLVREEDPPSPSTKVSSDRETSSAVAEARCTQPKQLVSLLRGDLDWITLKALEKDRSRRYGSASELSADLTRYLSHEPVMARPASFAYRLRKYVRRHRVGVAVAAGLLILLTSFAIMQAMQLRRITRERDRANRITDFMTTMFEVSDPSEARGNTITAREVLDKASKEIEAGLATDPDVQAQMMSVIGTVYGKLGLYSKAQSLIERAVADKRRVLGPENPETLKYASLLGAALYDQGQYAQAETLLLETIAVQRRVLGPEHADTLSSMSRLADVLIFQGRYAEAENLERETLDARLRLLGPEHKDTLTSMDNLASAIVEGNKKRAHEAEKLFRDALATQSRVLGPEHPDTLKSMSGLFTVLWLEGSFPEAEKLARQALAIERRVFGPEHPRTLNSMNSLAISLIDQGHYSEAEKLYTEARAIQQRVLGPNHPRTALSTYNLGCLAMVQGHREQALSLLSDAVDHGLRPDQALSMDQDPDLKPLHGDPRFAALVAHAKERAAAQKAN